jgi:ABC-type branched-subunit amino acid transport system substrate-binding protein
VQRLQAKAGVQLILGLGGAAAVVLVAAVVGAFTLGGGSGSTKVSASKPGPEPGSASSGVQPGAAGPAAGSAASPSGGNVAVGGAGPAGATAGTSGVGGAGSTANVGPRTSATLPSQPGATRIGLSASSFKFAVHGPVTLDGAPLSIAADPLDGIRSYADAINAAGGVNGRKIDYKIFDDKYTVDGGKTAANDIRDFAPFFISGTLGIDQIYQVSTMAKANAIPYMAAGGPENNTFRDLGMFEIAGNYDVHLGKLADFLGKETKKPAGTSIYAGKTKVGVSQLNSPFIAPVVKNFAAALQRNGLTLVKVVTVEKPTVQTSYGDQLQQLRDAQTEIFVPAQDPITTSREVAECKTQGCTWTYSFSDFAHDGDTDLALMQGEWSKPGSQVKGLSSACYYKADNAENPQFCAQMGTAHKLWVQTHGGGQQGEANWQQHGSGGSSGYQVDHFWLKAMKDTGSDPTREKLVAALSAYSGYDDLVTGPITFAGGSTHMHAATNMVVLEAQPTGNYKQLTPGLVDQF